jgi:hypothetical protein
MADWEKFFEEEAKKKPAPTSPTAPTSGAAPALETTPADGNWEKFFATEAAEPESRVSAMMLNGLTLGARPKIAAAIKSRSLFSGPEYEKARDEEYAKDDAYTKKNLGTAIAAEVVGSIPTMLVPGLGGVRVAQAANRASQVAQGLTRTQRMTRALGMGREVGTVGTEAGAVGLKTGAAQGLLGSREEDVAGKLKDTGVGAAAGYVLGRAGQAAGDRVARVGEHMVDAVRYGGDAQLGAVNALQRNLTRDRLTPDAIRQTMLPDTGRMAVTPEAKEVILRAYGEAIEKGATDSAARKAARAAYQPIASVKGKTAADSHIKSVVDSHLTKNEIPLALDELAQTTGSRGQNTHWTRRAAMNTPGEGREVAAEAIMGRQEAIIPKMRDRISQTVGDTDFEGALNQLRLRNQANSNTLYKAAFDNEVPFDLTPVLDQWNRKHAFLGGPVRKQVDDALATMRGTPDASGKYQRHTLESYIQSRGALNDMIGASIDPKTMRPTNATKMLVQLKKEMDGVVGAQNPHWIKANATHADGMAVDNAMRRGEQMGLTSSGKTRETLNWFEKATPDEQDAFKVGFARTLHTELSRLGDTHDVSKIFLKGGKDGADGVKAILRRVLGKDAANDLIEMARRSKVATRTNQAYGNSQTTPLKDAGQDLNSFGKIAGLLQSMNPIRALGHLGEAVGDRLNEGRNLELLNRLSVMSDQPHRMFDLIRELERVQQNRLGAFTAPGVNAYSGGGLVGAGTAGAVQDRRNR